MIWSNYCDCWSPGGKVCHTHFSAGHIIKLKIKAWCSDCGHLEKQQIYWRGTWGDGSDRNVLTRTSSSTAQQFILNLHQVSIRQPHPHHHHHLHLSAPPPSVCSPTRALSPAPVLRLDEDEPLRTQPAGREGGERGKRSSGWITEASATTSATTTWSQLCVFFCFWSIKKAANVKVTSVSQWNQVVSLQLKVQSFRFTFIEGEIKTNTFTHNKWQNNDKNKKKEPAEY